MFFGAHIAHGGQYECALSCDHYNMGVTDLVLRQ